MAWFQRLPRTIAFLDVETTGLGDTDRVVSLGSFWLAGGSLSARLFPFSYIHLIFNPGKPSHPRAAAVHGYSDWLLKHQDPFSRYAAAIHDFLNSADLIVAHNVAFDIGFVNAEFARVGLPAVQKPTFCTMEAAQRTGVPATLDAACARLKLSRSAKNHGALEDAWLAMQVYLCIHGSPTPLSFVECGRLVEPFNVRPAGPQIAVGASQDRSNTGRSTAATPGEAERIDRLVNDVKQLKREHAWQNAERLLLAEVERQEANARRSDHGVAPWYYEQLAIVYSKQGRREDEIQILERYSRQPHAPGALPGQLLARLEKVRAKVSGVRARI